jgi:hypothetical protein
MKQVPQRTLLRLLHHNWNRRTLNAVSYLCERFLFRGCFTEIETLGIEEVVAKAEAGRRLIFIPDHQSEYDWLMLQSRMYLNGIRTVIQAGDNLFVGPLDPILRGCGAFMSVREKHSFYSSHWIANLAMKYLGKKPIVVTRDIYSTLYNKQLKRILGRDNFNILVFPGYETDPYSGAVKYGRSYSGLFNPLSPYVFIMISKALKELGIQDAEYIPVSVSYERVPEDSLFREFRTTSRRKRIAKYIYDHYYTFFKAPFSKELRQEKTRVCIKFGAGLPVDFGGKARQFADQIHLEIGRLVRVYESTLLFHSVKNKFIIPKKELKGNIQRDLEKLHRLGVDCSPLYDSSGRLISLERMLRRVESIFNFPKNPVSPLKSYLTMDHDKNEVFILNPHLAAYYANKLRYILSQD